MFCFSWLISYYCILHKHSTTWNSLNILSSYQLKPNMKLTWNQIWNSGYRILISNSGCLRTILGLPWWLRWKRICLQCRRSEFDSWVGETPRRREWHPTAVVLPGESHGQRSLADTVHGVAESRTRLRTSAFTVAQVGACSCLPPSDALGGFLCLFFSVFSFFALSSSLSACPLWIPFMPEALDKGRPCFFHIRTLGELFAAHCLLKNLTVFLILQYSTSNNSFECLTVGKAGASMVVVMKLCFKARWTGSVCNLRLASFGKCPGRWPDEGHFSDSCKRRPSSVFLSCGLISAPAPSICDYLGHVILSELSFL